MSARGVVYATRDAANATGSTSVTGASTALAAACQAQHAEKSWSAFGVLSAGVRGRDAGLSGARHNAWGSRPTAKVLI